jgi:hypothetical protein
MNELHGDQAAQALVPRQPHFPHASLADPLEQLVATDALEAHGYTRVNRRSIVWDVEVT